MPWPILQEEGDQFQGVRDSIQRPGPASLETRSTRPAPTLRSAAHLPQGSPKPPETRRRGRQVALRVVLYLRRETVSLPGGPVHTYPDRVRLAAQQQRRARARRNLCAGGQI